MNVKLYRAIQAGEIVHVTEVERGLKCGCICPNCGATLIARQGEERLWHFAHHESLECNLETAAETALHLAAKKVLIERKRLHIPPNRIVVCLSDSSGRPSTLTYPISLKILEFDHVDEEIAIGPYRADIVARIGGRELIVEIKVSHAVDDDKIEYLRKQKRSSIELDLSKLDRNISNEELADLLTVSGVPTKWIFNYFEQQKRMELTNQLQLEIDARNEVLNRERIAYQIAQDEKRKWATAVEQELFNYLKKGVLPENDSCKNLSKTRAKSLAALLGGSFEDLPAYIQIPIADERAFACASWVWQGWIFHTWLRCPTPEGAIGKNFRTLWVAQWAEKYLPIPQCVRFLSFPENKQLMSRDIQVPSPYETVRSYLQELSSLGFLERGRGDSFVVDRNDMFMRRLTNGPPFPLKSGPEW